MPVELLSEIFLSTLDITPVEEKLKLVINLCHTSHGLRSVALSTAKLWGSLAINLSIYDSSLVSEKNIGFLRWWGTVLWSQHNNNFSLRFTFGFLDGKFAPENKTSALDTQKMQTIVGLIARARVLELNCAGLTFLRGAIQVESPIPLPLLEDLRIGRVRGFQADLHLDKAREIYRFLALFDPPAIRRLAVAHVLGHPKKYDRTGAYWGMWPKLIEIDAEFTGELVEWRMFFSHFVALERARIVTSVGNEDDSNNGFDTATVPRLLHLDICGWGDIDRVLEGFAFPALKTLIIRGDELPISAINRALLATPSLERLELIGVLFESVINSSSRLVNLLPHLEHVTIDHEWKPFLSSERSLIEHIDALKKSGWLGGPWKRGPLTLEIICAMSEDDMLAGWPMESYDFGQVNITLKSVSSQHRVW